MKIPMTGLTAALLLAAIGASAAAQTAPAAPGAATRPPQPPAAKGPPAALALEAAQTAISACAANGYTVAASVVDSAGVLKVLLAADGARPGAIESSTRKAVTANTYETPTATIQERVKTDTTLAAAIAANPKLFARAGGQPLLSGGVVIGAIGVGGAPGGEKDDVCASVGIERVKNRL